MDILAFTADTDAFLEGSVVETRFKEYATVARHFVVIVLNTRRERYAPRKVGESLWIIPVNASMRALAPFQALAVARRELFFQGRLQCDVVDGRDTTSAWLVAWLVARRYRKPLHLFISNNTLSSRYGSESLRNWLTMLLARFLAPRADALSVASEPIRASLAELSAAAVDRTTVVPRFVDVSAIRSTGSRVDLAAKYPNFKFILLSVEPLAQRYNPRLAIATLAGVLREYPHAGLVIVGEGKEKKHLSAYAKHLGVGERVAFERPAEDISSYYKGAHVALITAPYEDYDDSVAKAAAASCVVVSTKVGLAPAVITNGESGFLCEIGDGVCFVKAVLAMIRDPSLHERVRLNGMLSVEKYMAQSAPETRVATMKTSWEAAIRNFKALSGGHESV